RIDLDIPAWIVVERLAGLRIDALGPVHLLDRLRGFEKLPVDAIEGVCEAVTARMEQDLPILTVYPGVDENVAAGLVVVAVIVGRVLVIPPDLAGRGIEGDCAVGVEIVARTIACIKGRYRVAGAPIGQVGDGVIGARAVERAATGAPRIVLVLPGLAAGLARRRDRKRLPKQVAAPGIKRSEPTPRAMVAARGGHQDCVLLSERRGTQLRETDFVLVEQLLFPHALSR